ncbi:hypothetical protein Desku_0911 [Desulfofundulus kuznetsovii DSM 6115]|uniref:Macro domain-containing protein n=1 Tax=Desulfofundulus kuznetsovii (strain DSM 6115 / VKM B-1805 / 17) TaxID=760568 RepID=A0AAU8PB51_DESK7|nr:hypothetical protein Desku_0911 [Desulfofundulus kuznetsovii DSM 6115]
MRTARGNLWRLAINKVLVITTNGSLNKRGECVMGRGIAREAKERFPELPRVLGDRIKQQGNRCFMLGKWGDYVLVSFPVKHRWYEKADPELIRKSASELVEIAGTCGFEEVYMPRPGCGNGRLSWEGEVRPLLRGVLDDRFVVCTWD